MEKEFVPYELAVKLKALGFDEPCIGYYYNGKICFDSPGVSLPGPSGEQPLPLYQQAFRWFREKHKLQHHIWSGKLNHIFYGYDILNIEEQEFVVNNSDIGGGDCDYDTYEEAEQACLKKLIEIVKNDNTNN